MRSNLALALSPGDCSSLANIVLGDLLGVRLRALLMSLNVRVTGLFIFCLSMAAPHILLYKQRFVLDPDKNHSDLIPCVAACPLRPKSSLECAVPSFWGGSPSLAMHSPCIDSTVFWVSNLDDVGVQA